MKIKKIKTKNFRTLEDFELDLGASYCAISGKNNSGKTGIIKIIQHFFDERDSYYFSPDKGISLIKDKTQWSKDETMEITISVDLHRDDDAEVFFVVDTYCTHNIDSNNVIVEITQKFQSDGSSTTVCVADGETIEERKASEIVKKFRASSNIIVHNSTNSIPSYLYRDDDLMEVLDASFSPEDQRKIKEAEVRLQNKVKKAAKQHKEELEKLLGKLSDSFHVELSTIDGGRHARVPLEIKLTDRNVEVPLTLWGAGTQNRTRVLISVLDALRIRSKNTAQDRSTPVLLLEEPESFLHPSAQAEFGQVLNSLAEEHQIQIIATTHSPYMLNQSDPSANILLQRKIYHGHPRETLLIDTSGDDWMLPFAENLGVIPSEFTSWKPIFSAHSSRIVLVEGDIDKSYVEFIRDKFPSICEIKTDVEILPYGGKDALKNTPILQFMLKRFGSVYITFDLDARNELKPMLEKIGLQENTNFCAIGVDGPGKDCIEGLIPSPVRQKVYHDNPDLVAALTSNDNKIKKSAKSNLKINMLEEFKKCNLEEVELNDFKKTFQKINKFFK